MRPELLELGELLQKPDAASSFLPLVLTLSLLGLGVLVLVGLLLGWLWSSLRWKSSFSPKAREPQKDAITPVTAWGKLRALFKRVFRKPGDGARSEEIGSEPLPDSPDQLRQTLLHEREKHAQAISKLDEIKEALASLESKYRDVLERLKAEIQKRDTPRKTEESTTEASPSSRTSPTASPSFVVPPPEAIQKMKEMLSENKDRLEGAFSQTEQPSGPPSSEERKTGS